MSKLLKYCQTGYVLQSDDRSTLRRFADDVTLPLRNLSQDNLHAVQKAVKSEDRSFFKTASQFLPVYETYLDAQDIIQGAYNGSKKQLNQGVVGLGQPFSGKAISNTLGYLTEKFISKDLADKNENKSHDILNGVQDMGSETFNKKLFLKYGSGGYDKWLKDGKPKLQTGGMNQSAVLAEKGEVFRRIDGKIQRVSDNAPTHDEGVITDVRGSKFRKASYNNGGIEVPMVESVLSATHENRNTNDESYTEEDEIIKVKPNELKEIGDSFHLSVKTKKSVSPSRAFELLKESKQNQILRLNKFQLKEFSTRLEKDSFAENSKQIKNLPEDNMLYEKLLRMQELKKQFV